MGFISVRVYINCFAEIKCLCCGFGSPSAVTDGQVHSVLNVTSLMRSISPLETTWPPKGKSVTAALRKKNDPTFTFQVVVSRKDLN